MDEKRRKVDSIGKTHADVPLHHRDDWHNVTPRRTEEELRPRLNSLAELERTPSRDDGISLDRERQIRRQVIGLIQEAGTRLELPSQAICTACHYFHRFYVYCSLKRHHYILNAQTCLYLASKVEESSRRIRDILNTTYRLHYPDRPPLRVTDEYWNMKDAVVRHEQLLLRVLGFNLTSRHPQHYVLHFLQSLEGTEELATLTWGLLNDSYRTTLCLQYRPEAIACAAMYLAAEMINFQLSNEEDWWNKFSAQRSEIEDICMQLLDIYDMPDTILCEADLGSRTPAYMHSEKAILEERKYPVSLSATSSPRLLARSAQSTPDLRPLDAPPAKKRRRVETLPSNPQAPPPPEEKTV